MTSTDALQLDRKIRFEAWKLEVQREIEKLTEQMIRANRLRNKLIQDLEKAENEVIDEL